MHSLGQSDLQHLRLATALLSAPGRLCEDVPRAPRRDRLVEVRTRQRQSALPGLHGPLRVRAERGERDVPLAQGNGRDHCIDGDQAAMTLAEQIERAFDYRGYVTVSRHEGGQVVGYIYARGPTYIEMFDETATRRTRLPVDEVAAVALTGDDTAARAQRMWEKRKGALEPTDASVWG